MTDTHTSWRPDARTKREIDELAQHFEYGPRGHSKVLAEAVHELYQRTFGANSPASVELYQREIAYLTDELARYRLEAEHRQQ
jgi:hypothetical protein